MKILRVIRSVNPAGGGPIDVNRLRLPLVRHGDDVTAGLDETTWTAWLARRDR